jgi:hypothetical protein
VKRLAVIHYIFTAVLVIAGAATASPTDDGFRITGIVVNTSNSSPVGNCQVMISPTLPADFNPQSPQGVPRGMTVTTGGDGRFVFNNVPIGKYSLVARRNGFRTQALNEHDEFTSAVAVGPDKDSQNIVFRLQPSASITGRVEDEFGDPVANGQVILFHHGLLLGKVSTHPRASTNTGSVGTFHFYRLPPGEYFVVVMARPWYAQYRQQVLFSSNDQPAPGAEEGDANLNATFPITYFSGALDSASATPIKLRPGDRFVADMKLNSEAGFGLSIRGEEPNTQFMIESRVFDMSMFMPQASVWIDEKGATDFAGIPPGRYRLRQRTTTEESAASERRQDVEISPDGNVEYRKPAEGTSVKGTLALEGSNQPLHETIIQFEERDTHDVVQAHLNAKGEFVPFQLFPGVFQYSAFSRQGVIKSFTATGAKVRGGTIEVGLSPVILNVTMADVATSIEGTVHSKEGKPIAGAMVVLIPDDPDHNQSIFRRDQSDTDGTFLLRVVMPGKYTLVAIQDGWGLEWSKMDVMRRFLQYGETIEVKPSQSMHTRVKVQSARE